MSTRSFLAFFAVLAVIGLLGFGLLSKGSASVQVGDNAPTGELPLLNGDGTAGVTDFRGRWILVNFWASWCVPCREESPTLEDFYRRHRAQRFIVLGIDTQDISDDGQAFANRYAPNYPQLRDGEGDLADDFGTTGVPENFLVDPKGRLVLIRRGPVDRAYLDQYVAPKLEGRS